MHHTADKKDKLHQPEGINNIPLNSNIYIARVTLHFPEISECFALQYKDAISVGIQEWNSRHASCIFYVEEWGT